MSLRGVSFRDAVTMLLQASGMLLQALAGCLLLLLLSSSTSSSDRGTLAGGPVARSAAKTVVVGGYLEPTQLI